ncbi:MAG TPA: hypothetical protein VK886_14685 [Vicinamibacterales bacterium]|nr:hypothetical protein [Vicinamibacterales bacterium]
MQRGGLFQLHGALAALHTFASAGRSSCLTPLAGPAVAKLLASAAICLLAIGCSETPKAPDTGGTNGGDGERISGSERLGWLQNAPSRQVLDSYDYAAYIDNQRVALAKPACAVFSDGVYDCSTPLPSMTTGRHTLELIASSAGLDSERSPQLVVIVGTGVQSATPSDTASQAASGDTASVEPTAPARHCVESSDECYDLELVADNLPRDARAPVALPDERILVVTEADRILSFAAEERIELAVDRPCAPPASSRIAALAVDPDFARSRRLFVAWHCETGAGATQLLIVRYRELNGVLGEGAAVYRQAVRPGTRSLVAVASDRTLFIAAAGRSSWSLLRVDPDGSAARGNLARSPVVLNVPVVTGLSSDPESGLTVLAMDQGPLLVARTTPRVVVTRVAADASVGSPVSVAVASLPWPREPASDVPTVFIGGAAGLRRLRLAASDGRILARGVADLGVPGIAALASAGDAVLLVVANRSVTDTGSTALYRLQVPLMRTPGD